MVTIAVQPDPCSALKDWLVDEDMDPEKVADILSSINTCMPLIALDLLNDLQNLEKELSSRRQEARSVVTKLNKYYDNMQNMRSNI